MRFMLLVHETIGDAADLAGWRPDARKSYLEHLDRLRQDLSARGELVARIGLAPAETARVVTCDGENPPVLTDGPLLPHRAYVDRCWVVEVDGEERALHIAGRLSAAPDPTGAALRQPVEVRAVVDVP